MIATSPLASHVPQQFQPNKDGRLWPTTFFHLYSLLSVNGTWRRVPCGRRWSGGWRTRADSPTTAGPNRKRLPAPPQHRCREQFGNAQRDDRATATLRERARVKSWWPPSSSQVRQERMPKVGAEGGACGGEDGDWWGHHVLQPSGGGAAQRTNESATGQFTKISHLRETFPLIEKGFAIVSKGRFGALFNLVFITSSTEVANFILSSKAALC